MTSFRETWGIAVNEGLCFGLAAIVSEEVGAGVDLVVPNENGYSFPAAVTDELADRMQRFIDLSPGEKRRMGERSQEMMRQWSERDLAGNLVEYINAMNGNQGDSGQVRSVTGDTLKLYAPGGHAGAGVHGPEAECAARCRH